VRYDKKKFWIFELGFGVRFRGMKVGR